MSNWWGDDPDFLREIENDIEEKFDGLRTVIVNGTVFINGRFDVFEDELYYDSYSISVELANNHPKTMPAVFETGGRIPKSSKRHVNEDGSACLFVPFERKLYWPDARIIGQFLGGPVNAYFYSQSYFERHKKYPFGERNHGIFGIFESMMEHSGISKQESILSVVELLKKDVLKGHWICPCGSGEILRRCHGDKIIGLKNMIGSDLVHIDRMVNDLKAAVIEKQKRDRQSLQRLLA